MQEARSGVEIVVWGCLRPPGFCPRCGEPGACRKRRDGAPGYTPPPFHGERQGHEPLPFRGKVAEHDRPVIVRTLPAANDAAGSGTRTALPYSFVFFVIPNCRRSSSLDIPPSVFMRVRDRSIIAMNFGLVLSDSDSLSHSRTGYRTATSFPSSVNMVGSLRCANRANGIDVFLMSMRLIARSPLPR